MPPLVRKTSHWNDATYIKRYAVYTDNACYGMVLLGEYGSYTMACFYRRHFENKYGACIVTKI